MPVLQKLGVANTLTALLERTLKYGWPLVGTSLVSAITAWAAAATELLHPYAPLSWVAAGLVGGLIFVVLVWVGVAIRNAMISGNVRRRFYETGSRINPLEKIFENRRINIVSALEADKTAGRWRDLRFCVCHGSRQKSSRLRSNRTVLACSFRLHNVAEKCSGNYPR